MTRRFLFCLILALTSREVLAQRSLSRFVYTGTYAGKPAAGLANQLAIITDCADTSCSTGGGSTVRLMRDTGSAWAVLGDGDSGGSPAFSSITAGTNGAALVVGTNGSLTVSGSGTINATSLGGTAAASYALLNSPSFTTPTLGAASATSIAFGADPADAGAVRLSNNTNIAWEAATPGTDLTLSVNASDLLVYSGTLGSMTATSFAFGADPADAGAIRCSNNATCLASEIATPGTDATIKLNASDLWEFSHGISVPSVTTSGSTPFIELPQGTASAASANSIRIIPPTGITTAYRWILPTGVGATGVLKGSVSSNDATLSLAAIADADVPDNITITLAATATALASNPTDCSANQFANAIAASGNLTCAAIADADVPDTITASNYMPLAGGVFTGPVTLEAAAAPTTDAAGEHSFDTNAWGTGRGAVQVYDGTANVWLVGILASDTCANGEVAKFNTGGTWTCEADATGGTAAWDSLTAPTGAVSLVSNGTSETVTIDFQAAFTTGSQFVVKSSTGNPSGGVLAEVLGHDADVTLVKITNGGSNGVQVSAAGALTAIGTGAITATDGDSATSFFSSGTIEAGRLPTASDTASGISELATAAETTTGTDAARAVTPDGLAGSTIFGVKTIEVEIFPAGTAATTGDGKTYFRIPASLNGMNLISVKANVYTAGTTGTINLDIARCAAAATGNVCSGTVSDVLSTNLTIDSGENSSDDAAAAAVIDTGQDDVATGQLYRFDIDAIHTTPSQGMILELSFQLP